MIDRMFNIAFNAIEALIDHLARAITKAPDFRSGESEENTVNSQSVSAPSPSQLGRDLLGRLVSAVDSFPAFSTEQKQAVRQKVFTEGNSTCRIKPRYGTPILLSVEAKTKAISRAISSLSTDHSLGEADGKRKCTADVNRDVIVFNKNVPLSTPNDQDSILAEEKETQCINAAL